MDPSLPLSKLVLAAASVADDLGFMALAELSDILGDRTELEYRLIGGHMVSLHVQRWALGHELYRETADIDLGLPTVVAKDGWLMERLQEKGYKRTASNRLERPITDIPVLISGSGEGEGHDKPMAAIHILVSAHTSRA